MPVYDYKCKSCEDVFEVTRSLSDTSDVRCPSCGGDTKRVFSPVGVVFKGSGFYNTDYKNKSSSGQTKEKAAKNDSAAPCPAKESGGCPGCAAAE